MNSLTLVCLVTCCAAAALAMPYPMPYPMPFPEDGYGTPHVVAPAYGAAAPSYGEVGRVKMQIYRGPSEVKGKHGYETEYFAPWGYYVTQPEDKKRASYGH